MNNLASVYVSSRTLNQVEEVITDLVICELAGTEPDFVEAAARVLR